MGRNSRGGALIEGMQSGQENIFAFQDEEQYFPLFCLAKPPDEYFDALNSTCRPDTPWLAISSCIPSLPQLLTEIKTHLDEPPSKPTPTPFLNCTISQIYSFFKGHLRGPTDTNIRRDRHFSDFTFLVVDSECFNPLSPSTQNSVTSSVSCSDQNHEHTILLCSDAPDFHESETEIRLKTCRVPVINVFLDALSLETLTLTPSEILRLDGPDSDGPVVKLLPPATWIPVEPFTNSRDQEYRLATPAEARSRKKEGIKAAVAAGWVEGKGWDDDAWKMVES